MKTMRNSFLLAFFVSMSFFAGQEFITYEEFGAKGDGRTNDHPAIIKAHAAANEKGLPVKARQGAVYYIGNSDAAAVIKTDTDFTGARFLIDDVVQDFKHRRVEVFSVERDEPSYDVKIDGPLFLNTQKLNQAFKTAVMLEVQNKNVRQFIRWGVNQNDGVPASDRVLVGKDGALDPGTPFVWEFPQVTSATAYPIEDKPITIRGGEFITFANQAESKYNYYARGIHISRSNVTLVGAVHFVQNEGLHGAPYSGFFGVSHCANVVLRDVIVTGHKIYNTIGSAGSNVSMGSYDLSVERAINVSFLNVRQSNDICDTRYWGILGSNFCRNLLYDHCYLSRFDAHQGVCNATIRNSELGHQSVELIGYGQFILDNTVVHGDCLINLRVDYGSFWRGNILIRNCTLVPLHKNYTPNVISGSYTGLHNFGYQCMMPFEVQILGLRIFDGANREYAGPTVFGDFNKDYKPGYQETYPYLRPQRVIVRGVVTESGQGIRPAVNPAFFPNTLFDIQPNP